MMNNAALLAAAWLIPVIAAAGVALAGRRPNLREGVTLTAASAAFACVLALTGAVLAGEQPQLQLLELLPGLTLAFRLEPLGALFALVASGLWIANSIYSIGYMRANKAPRQTVFYVCFALAIAAALGIAFSANLLTLFFFYEALTLITWPLVTHNGDARARSGGRAYIGVLLGTSLALLLPAIIAVWHFAGDLEFRPGGILPDDLGQPARMLLLALFAFGVAKAALMPVHRWLPAAMVAPTPVSALLHAVAVVKAGVFTLIKVIVYIFGIDFLADSADWLLLLAAFTIVAASLVALRCDNLKRMLAYSTIAQLGYVTLAAAMLSPEAVSGAALHIVSHACAKITLFFAAGAIYIAAHKTEISQLNGIGRRMPWTMAAFTLASLSLLGIPPLAGFVSKWFILDAAVNDQQIIAIAVLVIGVLLNAAYLMPVVYAAFFRPLAADDVAHPHGEAPKPMLLAMTISSCAIIAVFLFSDPLMQLAQFAPGALAAAGAAP